MLCKKIYNGVVFTENIASSDFNVEKFFKLIENHIVLNNYLLISISTCIWATLE